MWPVQAVFGANLQTTTLPQQSFQQSSASTLPVIQAPTNLISPPTLSALLAKPMYPLWNMPNHPLRWLPPCLELLWDWLSAFFLLFKYRAYNRNLMLLLTPSWFLVALCQLPLALLGDLLLSHMVLVMPKSVPNLHLLPVSLAQRRERRGLGKRNLILIKWHLGIFTQFLTSPP